MTIEVDLAFATDPASTTLVASLSDPQNPVTVELGDLVTSLSPTLGAAVPGGLRIGIRSVKIASLSGSGGPRKLGASLDLTASLSLTDLPLIGDKLPAGETIALQDLQVSYASAQLTAEDAKVANALLPSDIAFPATGLQSGPTIVAVVRLPGESETLGLPVGAPSAPAPSAPGLAAPGPPSPAAPTAKWWQVQKQLGVVQFQRFGIVYDAGALFLAIDAAMGFGPLSLSLRGLGLGSSLTSFEPKMRLSGIGVEFREPPLEVAGSVLRVEPPPAGTRYQFDGSLLISAVDFTLAAIGSYAVLEDGQPSLFVFAQLEHALGGPPSFFVTGLMAGFGFNRTLVLPTQDQVLGFPLLVLNRPPAPGQTPPPQDPGHVLDVIEGRVPAVANDPTSQHQWVAPQPGSYWLAVGVEFMSFELVSTRAVLIAELGDQLVFALLGLSTAKLPQAVDNSNPYAYVELELEAVLKPTEGFFGLTAILAASSYVIVPSCKLTGGFAFYVWFPPSDHSGQFVLTLGGYHPAFTPPSYFPQVPRLGFHWAVSDKVSIGGNAYFALTTTAVMAGGRLEALFSDGNLRAWFDMSADLLISWRPFFFTASIEVDIGISVRLDLLFCHTTISLSLGASVQLWGPPTGGTVHVHLWCVSFTVSFGSSRAGTATQPLKWHEMSSLLPGAGARTVTMRPGAGLYKTVDDKPASHLEGAPASTSGKTWIVRANGFSFATSSAVPATHLCYGVAPPDNPTAGALHTAAQPVDIRPMNLGGVTSVHRLIVHQGSPTAPAHDVSGWTLGPATGNVPDALWGSPPSPFTQTPKPRANVVPGQLTGFAAQTPLPQLGASPGFFRMSELALFELEPPGVMPLAGSEPALNDYVPTPAPSSVADIAQIATHGSDRAALLAALAPVYAGPDDDLSKLAQQADDLFSDAPMEQRA